MGFHVDPLERLGGDGGEDLTAIVRATSPPHNGH
jgi:hypothetical protein